MTIVAPQPNLFPDLANGRLRGPKLQETASASPSPSFESMVAGESNHATGTAAPVAKRGEGQPLGPTAEQIEPYKLEVAIGDRAVSFDAKPLLAPVATTSDTMGTLVETMRPFPAVGQSGAGFPREAPQLALAVRDSNNGPDVTQARANISVDRLQTISRVTIHVPRHVAAVARVREAPAAEVRSSRISIEILRTSNTKFAAMEASRASTDTMERSEIFARLVAFDGVYRVRTRGADLTTEEIDRLAERIRAALREYGFADRPVAISNGLGAG